MNKPTQFTKQNLHRKSQIKYHLLSGKTPKVISYVDEKEDGIHLDKAGFYRNGEVEFLLWVTLKNGSVVKASMEIYRKNGDLQFKTTETKQDFNTEVYNQSNKLMYHHYTNDQDKNSSSVYYINGEKFSTYIWNKDPDKKNGDVDYHYYSYITNSKLTESKRRDREVKIGLVRENLKKRMNKFLNIKI